MVKKQILSNGVRVISEHMPHLRSCSVGIWAECGSRHETPEVSGISHYIEHMLFKGTEKMNTAALACAFDEIGGQVNAFTSKDHTCFYARTTDRHLLRAFNLLFDMYKNSVFDKNEAELERGVIYEEIDMCEDTPDDLVNEIVSQNIYKGDALGMPVLGTRESLASITPEILKKYHREHYVGKNTIVTICGSFDKETYSQICAALEQLPEGERIKADGEVKYFPCVELRRKKIEQNHLLLAFRGVPLGDKDRFVMAELSNILGAGMSSRLFQQVREKHGLCYSVYSFTANYIGAGMLGIYVGLSKDSEQKALSLIKDILDDLKNGGVTEKELARTKEQLKTSLLMGMESTVSRMNAIGRDEMVYGRALSEKELTDGYDSVTAEQITALAQRIFDYKTMSIGAVGSVSKKSDYTGIFR